MIVKLLYSKTKTLPRQTLRKREHDKRHFALRDVDSHLGFGKMKFSNYLIKVLVNIYLSETLKLYFTESNTHSGLFGCQARVLYLLGSSRTQVDDAQW